MRNEPVNVFDSGHMSIDNIKSVYITAAINAEARQMARVPRLERSQSESELAGAAGAMPSRFGGTRTPILARDRPAWWYGGPPLQVASKFALYDSLPVPEFVIKKERPMKLPPPPPAADASLDLDGSAAEHAELHNRSGTFVKRALADKLTRIEHASYRAPTSAPLGIAHNLPAEQGGLEYFPRRPEAEEYAHGQSLQLARGIQLRGLTQPPPVDEAHMARKVLLVAGADARILGPQPRAHGAQSIPDAVRRRMPKPPTAKITGEHDLNGGADRRQNSAVDGGERAHAARVDGADARGGGGGADNDARALVDGAGAVAETAGQPTERATKDAAASERGGVNAAEAAPASGASSRHEDRIPHHRQDYGAAYAAKKHTLSQVHFGDHLGPLGKSALW